MADTTDQSYDERRTLVQNALREARGSDVYIDELFDDRAIYSSFEEEPGKTWEVPYTVDGDDVAFGDRVEVKRTVSYMAVKSAGPDLIEGLAMPFGYDVDGESFTADTDFCFDWFGKSGRPFLYDHGLDDTLKGIVMGRQTDYEVRDEGVWAQVQLDRNVRYRKAVDGLIEQGALGFSSGAMPHLATKSARGHITRWPWVELSGTPIPAHPGALNLHYVKSADAIRHLEAVDIQIPDPLKAALAALDEWAEDDGLPDGLKFADHVARVLGDVEAVRDRARSISGLRAKAGRVLSASTRERLMRHPASLREFADDLDELLSDADAQKSTDLSAALLDYQRTLSRLNGVELPAQGATQ